MAGMRRWIENGKAAYGPKCDQGVTTKRPGLIGDPGDSDVCTAKASLVKRKRTCVRPSASCRTTSTFSTSWV